VSDTLPVLPAGMPGAAPDRSGLDIPFWEGTRSHELWIQRCNDCGGWQWGPEWICHRCHGFEMDWEQVESTGRIYSWMRVWHPVHPAMSDGVPFNVVLVELPQAGGVRMIGNLVGEGTQTVEIGAKVEAVFEDHDDAEEPYTLVQWKPTEPKD